MNQTPEQQKQEQLEESRPVREMPRYQSHKKVWALKIREIRLPETFHESNKSRWIVPFEDGYDSFAVNGEYMEKHKPEVGGYFVQYEDGYKSFSPAQAFEAGYTLLT